jgi:outer membrane protein assembly factor BamB
MRNALGLALAFLWLTSDAHAGDWRTWRGPQYNGVAPDRDLPSKFSEKPGDPNSNLLWKVPYGCRSTPIVMDGRVFMIGDVGEGVNEQERVVCLDADTGKLIWEKRFNIWLVDIVSSRVGWTSLAGDAETGYIYAHGTQGLFTCFDKNGKIIWQRSLIEENGRICGYGGRLASPVIDGDLVILGIVNANFGDQARGANRFLAVDKRTGKTVWWTDTGFQVNDTYQCTPVVGVIGGQRLLVSGGGDGWVHAMKVRTGEMVWSYHLAEKAVNCSPVIDGDIVWIGNGEENFGGNGSQGAVICFNGASLTEKKDPKTGKTWMEPKVLWRVDDVKVMFASPVLKDGRLYVAEETGKLFCFDAKNGTELWNQQYGRAARGSPVWADGKIYITDVNARFVVLQPGDTDCKKLYTHIFRGTGGTVEVNGTPAIANGRIYLPTADNLYCIGKKDHSAEPDKIPAPVKEPAADKDAKPAKLLVYPLDVVLHPGGTEKLEVHSYDDHGRFLGKVEAEWSLPAPPIPPMAKVGPPPLKGTVEKGLLTVDSKLVRQMGPVEASFGGLKARARVRVVPTLPYTEDFEKVPVGAVPGGWVNCAGKFVVEEKGGSKVLRKTTANPNPLLAQVYSYMGLPSYSDYTIEADVMGGRVGDNLPDMGVVANRYTLQLDGASQTVRIVTWDAVPRLDKQIPFKWKEDQWFRFKLTVELKDDKAIIKGKVWPKGTPEPEKWTVEVEDPKPNTEGAPALYGNAIGAIVNQLTPIWFDNIVVTPNKK